MKPHRRKRYPRQDHHNLHDLGNPAFPEHGSHLIHRRYLQIHRRQYPCGRPGFFVTEACEYTNSFLSFFPKIGIILNIEEDHLDFFKDINDIRASFRRFAELLPADGSLIINRKISNLTEITEGLPCKVLTFGEAMPIILPRTYPTTKWVVRCLRRISRTEHPARALKRTG